MVEKANALGRPHIGCSGTFSEYRWGVVLGIVLGACSVTKTTNLLYAQEPSLPCGSHVISGLDYASGSRALAALLAGCNFQVASRNFQYQRSTQVTLWQLQLKGRSVRRCLRAPVRVRVRGCVSDPSGWAHLVHTCAPHALPRSIDRSCHCHGNLQLGAKKRLTQCKIEARSASCTSCDVIVFGASLYRS